MDRLYSVAALLKRFLQLAPTTWYKDAAAELAALCSGKEWDTEALVVPLLNLESSQSSLQSVLPCCRSSVCTEDANETTKAANAMALPETMRLTAPIHISDSKVFC
jgi:hypothetical protein